MQTTKASIASNSRAVKSETISDSPLDSELLAMFSTAR